MSSAHTQTSGFNFHSLPVCSGKQAAEPTSRPNHHALIFFMAIVTKRAQAASAGRDKTASLQTWQTTGHIMNR